jgi:hypothetical protein
VDYKNLEAPDYFFYKNQSDDEVAVSIFALIEETAKELHIRTYSDVCHIAAIAQAIFQLSTGNERGIAVGKLVSQLLREKLFVGDSPLRKEIMELLSQLEDKQEES